MRKGLNIFIIVILSITLLVGCSKNDKKLGSKEDIESEEEIKKDKKEKELEKEKENRLDREKQEQEKQEQEKQKQEEQEKQQSQLEEENKTKRLTEEASVIKEKYGQKALELQGISLIGSEESGREADEMPYYSIDGEYYDSTYYDEWDNLLQEVWESIKANMPEIKFEELKVEQNDWIRSKERIFNEFGSETSGMRRMGYEFLTRTTADRTFDLIGNYMNWD